MSNIETRPGGNAPGLPGSRPLPPTPTVMSRRAALGATAAIALGLGSLAAMPAGASVAPLAAVSPLSADAGLIALAWRIETLATAENRLSARASSICDRVDDAIGPAPLQPRPSVGLEIKSEIVGDRIVETMTRPVHLPERDAILEAYDIAVAAHEGSRNDLERRLGLPGTERCTDRMRRRLSRYSAELAGLRPVTPAGLAAKAAAMVALMNDDWVAQGDAIQRHGELLMAVLRDAARLGAAGAA